MFFMKRFLYLFALSSFVFCNIPVFADEDDDDEISEEEDREEEDENEDSDDEESEESEDEEKSTSPVFQNVNVELSNDQKKKIHQSVDKILGINGPESSVAQAANMKKEYKRLKKENQQLKSELEKLKKGKGTIKSTRGKGKVEKRGLSKNTGHSKNSYSRAKTKKQKWNGSSLKTQRRIYTIKNRGQGYGFSVQSNLGSSSFIPNSQKSIPLVSKSFISVAPSYKVADMQVSAVQQNGKKVYTIKSNPTFQNSKTEKNLSSNIGDMRNLFTNKKAEANYFGKTDGCQSGCSKNK